MNWKKISLWSGLGGLLFGTAVYAIKKSGPKPPLYAEPIPKGVKRLLIELESLVVEEAGVKTWIQQCYACEPTSFYVWSVLPTAKVTGKLGRGVVVTETQGTQIFFVVPTLRKWQGESREHVGPGTVEEGFYATIRVHTDWRRKPLISQIAREYPIEFRKCLVGGGPNGIETGEVILSQQTVVDYHFDMT